MATWTLIILITYSAPALEKIEGFLDHEACEMAASDIREELGKGMRVARTVCVKVKR